MYGNYITSVSNDRDDPECATYPKSGGRIYKRWGNRFNCKPIPMIYDDDDDESEDSHQASNEVDDLNDVLARKNSNNDENEGEKDQLWQHDSHQDQSGELTSEELLPNASSGSIFERSHGHREHTYPNTFSMNAACHPLSESIIGKEEIQDTPLKPMQYQLAKTELKKKKESWLDGFLSKTPHPEGSHPGNNSHLFGDSGIGMATTTKPSIVDGNQESVVKTSSRTLFTPASNINARLNAQETSGCNMLLQNKTSEINVDMRKGFTTPLCSRTGIMNRQNEETPMKFETIEKAEIQDMLIIQKSGKKQGPNRANSFSDENKENLNMPFVATANHSQETGEKKLLRSQSHASVLKFENDEIFTPSREERPSSTVTAVKSLSNLFHSGIPQNVHPSRIPTPVRLNTPLKQNPFSKPDGNKPETHVPVMNSHTPNVKELHPPLKSAMVIDSKQGGSSHQFGSAPIIHSLLSNPAFTSHSGRTNGQNSSLTNLGNASYSTQPSKSHSGVGLFHDIASQLGISHIFHSPDLKSASDPHQSSIPNSSHPFAKESMGHNNFVNPNDVDNLASRNKTDHFVSNNNDSAPSQSVFLLPSSQAQSIPRKAFAMKQPIFQAPSNNIELYNDITPSSSSHSMLGQSSYPNPIQSNIQTSHAPFSTPSAHSHTFKATSFQGSTSTASTMYSGSFQQQMERNQFGQHASHPSFGHVGHQPAHGLFSNTHPGHDSANLSQGHQIAQPMNIMPKPSDSITPNHVNVHASSGLSAGQEFAVPAAVKARPADSGSVTVARQSSVQVNRKILVVNKKSYEVLRLLGKGASSKVYDVIDLHSNRCVAVKRVVLRQGDSLVEGYLKEVELLNQLQGSEYIIKLIDSEVSLERGFKVLYMVMERGEMDLSTSIRIMSASKSQQMPATTVPRSKIPVITIIYYWVSMLNAVDEIHRKGIVHSDLKPANFLLVGGQLKLIDFGIATAVQTDVTSVLKDDPAGTPNYMSPEAIGLTVVGSPNSEDIFKKPKASYKSDVWSLGCILYSLIYGRSPFQHITNERIKLDAIRNPNYAILYPSEYPVHPPLIRALKRCLVRDYKQRASIAELKNIDYLYSNDDIDEESWEAWKTSASQKILSALSPESRMQVIKVIQEVFKSPPTRKKSS